MSIDETYRENEEGGSLYDEMECLCLNCGVTHYIRMDLLIIEDFDEQGRGIVSFPNCSECGGVLLVIGKKGDDD